MNKRKTLFVLLGLMSFTCIFSLSPFWQNQCSHQLSEAEKAYLMQKYLANIEDYEKEIRGWEMFDENEIKERVEKYREKLDVEGYRERLEKTYIPCGVDELTIEEKFDAAERRRGVLGEMSHPPTVFFLPVIRFDLEYADRGTYRNQVNTYHYVGYTFFYIPVIRAFRATAGGMMGICPFSSACEVR